MFFYIVCIKILSGFISLTIKLKWFYSKFFRYTSFFTLSTIIIRKSSDNRKDKSMEIIPSKISQSVHQLFTSKKLIAKIMRLGVVYLNHQIKYCNSSWILSCILGILGVPIHIKNCLDWQQSLGYRFNCPFI